MHGSPVRILGDLLTATEAVGHNHGAFSGAPDGGQQCPLPQRLRNVETAAFESDAALLGRLYLVDAPQRITASSVVKGLKAAMSILGVCSGLPCPPLAPLSAAQLEQVKHILQSAGASRTAAVAQQQ